eukprot:6040468-Alexandrium_andersonii.AAC.1
MSYEAEESFSEAGDELNGQGDPQVIKAESGLKDLSKTCEYVGIENYEAEESISEVGDELNSQVDPLAESGNQLL